MSFDSTSSERDSCGIVTTWSTVTVKTILLKFSSSKFGGLSAELDI